MTNEHGLSEKEEAFCQAFIDDLNATQAAIRAGYSENSARQIGYQNLTKLHIRARIDVLKTERTERLLMKADDVLFFWHSAATVDLLEFFDDNGQVKLLSEIKPEYRRLITGIKQTKYGTELTILDKGKSLELTARHFALFNDKLEIKHDYESLSDDELAARAAAQLAALNKAKDDMGE